MAFSPETYALLKAQGGGGGGSSGVLIVHQDDDTYALDKTWQELYDAVAQGKLCLLVDSGAEDDFAWAGQIILGSVYTDPEQDHPYFVRGLDVETFSAMVYSTDSPNGYPSD